MTTDSQTPPKGAREQAANPWQTWRILLLANAFSLVGNYVQNLALPLWVLSVTGSYSATGITFAVGTLPVVLCAPLAGRIVDRFNRLAVFIACEGICALLVLILIVGVRAESLVVVYVISALLKAVGSAAVPAVQAMLKERLSPDETRPVIARFEMVFGMTMSLGPLVGAALSAGIGIEGALWANCASFVASGLLAMLLRPSRTGARGPKAPSTEKQPRTRLEPLRWSALSPLLRRVALAEASYFLFLGAEVVIALAVFQETVGVAAAAVYQTLTGIGWIAGSSLVVRRFNRQPLVIWTGAAISAAATAALAFSGQSWSWVAVVLVGLLGGTGNVMIAGATTVVYQAAASNEIIGRIFAFRRGLLNLFMTASYVAIPLMGDLTNHPAPVLLVAGLVNLVITTWLLLPHLRARTGEGSD
ncbi:MFS transporter [Streptomyces profundus]|uniref:MFS transporter n=1 Tax=Streptomyces profundus TaxID=2867410 RepID=UPI001D16DDD9|nr:MFS transporter [Streptomyces sp. MA3_2.13]